MDVELLNDQLAREHSIDEYYARSPWPIRFIENRRLAVIRDFIGDAGGLSIAEVGSGGGHVLRMFPRARLTALDVSGVYLDIARRNLAGYDVEFVKGEIELLERRGVEFDRIICTEVLEHVVDPDAVLTAMARLLATGGFAVITVPNDPLINRGKTVARRSHLTKIVGDRIEWGGDRYHLHMWTPSQFENLLRQHFRIVDRRAVPFALCPVRMCYRCAQLA